MSQLSIALERTAVGLLLYMYINFQCGRIDRPSNLKTGEREKTGKIQRSRNVMQNTSDSIRMSIKGQVKHKVKAPKVNPCNEFLV